VTINIDSRRKINKHDSGIKHAYGMKSSCDSTGKDNALYMQGLWFKFRPPQKKILFENI
jgi:hypothetical protein